MSGRVRIYDLSKELGIDNKTCLELCKQLNIKDTDAELKASSSLIEAQAERVRRRAKRDGLANKSGKTATATATGTATQRRSQRRPPTRRPKRTRTSATETETEEEATKPATKSASKTKSVGTKSAGTKATDTKAAAAKSKSSDTKTAATKSTSKTKATDDKSTGAKTTSKTKTKATDSKTPSKAKADPGTASETDSDQTTQTQPQPQTTQPDQVISSATARAKATPDTDSDSDSETPQDPAPTPATPVSSTGKPIPPPPRRSGNSDIMVGGEAFVPGSSRRGRSGSGSGGPGPGAPTQRRQRTRGGSQVDAVFNPNIGRLSSGAQNRRKSDKTSGNQLRNQPQRRRRGGRRRRRSVEDLRPLEQQHEHTTPATTPIPKGTIEIPRNSSAQQVAPLLNRTAGDLVKYFMDNGEVIAAAIPLSDDHIELYAAEIGAEVQIVDLEQEAEAELQELLELDDLEPAAAEKQPRPPIVTIMGHVDHGKTTLLDTIRQASVVDDEAGGITQHIGAYHVKRNGQSITFIDTPGHEAFTAMRSRGANVTDVVVLVVAADDGLMPQTEEAIAQAQQAEVPILVAINKMDKPDINPDRIRQQLSEKGLVPEAWGGDTVIEEISALSGDGIDSLLESILLQAEMQELIAAGSQRATGVVLESHKDIGRGPVATLLVLEGTLKVGDPLVAGAVWGRVRALQDENGKQVKSAGPSIPVQVLGLSDVAVAGEPFAVAPTQKIAEKVGSTRGKRMKASDLGRDIGARNAGARLEDIFASISAGETVTLNLVVKADVHGSMEALVSSLKKLERSILKLAFVRQGVGGITENDVQLAMASNATIIGFNVRPDANSRQLAAKEDVDIRLYEVIYKVTEDVENALLGMLKPEFEERVVGEAEVREVFKISGTGSVAGCFVNSGAIKRDSLVRFLRDGAIIWRGTVKTLRRFQDEVAEVAAGLECGIGLSDFQDLKPGDIIETFEEHEIPVSQRA